MFGLFRRQFSAEINANKRNPIFREKSASLQSQSLQIDGNPEFDQRQERGRNQYDTEKGSREASGSARYIWAQ